MKQYAALDDTVYFWFAANDTSGSGGDGATPASDVRLAGAAADAAPVYSPTPALLSHVNYPAGAYEIAIAATAANGFAANNTYAIFCTLAIDAQNPTGFVGSFDLKPVEANITQLLGTAWLTPGVAGTPDVNAKLLGGTAQTGNDVGADVNDILTDTGTTLDTLIKDIPTVSEFNARTILAANYVVIGDTIAGVTAVTNDVGITQAGADKVWGTAARALTDKAGFALSAAGITAIWEKNISAYAGAGYAGTYLKTVYDDWLNAGRLDLILDAIAADVLNIDGDAMRGTNSAALASVCTEARLAHLNADIDSRSSHNAAAIWSAGSRTLSAPADYKADVSLLALEATLTAMKGSGFVTGTDSLEAVRNRGDSAWITGGGGSAADIADAVWDELQSGHTNAGSFGKYLDAMISGVGGAVGSGALSCTWTQKDDEENPMDNVQVWITTDEAGINIIAGTLITDANGEVTFMLDEGTYYVWRERAGYNFTNPQTWSVS